MPCMPSVPVIGSSAVDGPLPDIAPPVVTLNATLPSDTRALAVIDGELYFVGDMVQGWELSDVQPRRIMLRSPSKATVTIDMPLLAGSVAVPAATDG